MENCRSLEAFILGALINAADSHAACCHEDKDWAPYYAKHIAAQLKPILCGLQASVTITYSNPASVGAEYASRRK